jgi:hypothetical protein
LINSWLRTLISPATTLLFVFWCGSVLSFEIDGRKWDGAETEIRVGLEGISATGILWNTAFIDALNEWSQETAFNFLLREENHTPCMNDFINGVDFTSSVCGTEFGANTLAVTLINTQHQILGPPRIVEADIVINNQRDFDIYDGSLIQFGMDFAGVDFRRIALHELGHMIGLDHNSAVPAESIMAPSIGNIHRLQDDDIEAVSTLYGGLSKCHFSQLSFGKASGSLADGDCTVDKLTVGGTDDSFIDVYRFEVGQRTTMQFETVSAALDSVLLLSDSNLNFLGFDTKSSSSCSSSLSQTLGVGSYLLMVNTYDVPVKEECGNSGGYELTSTFVSDSPQGLGDNLSLNGGASNALFTGGISADNGSTYGSKFSSTDSLDISASIEIDPQHVGQAGFLLIAVVANEEIFLLNSQGVFINYTADPQVLTKASNKPLSSTEQLEIFTDLVPAEVGIDSTEVDILVAYGLDSEPSEVYFHQTPMNLIISP